MIENLTVSELKSKLDAGEEVILIDCREQGEWDEGHIAQAQLMPLSNFAEEINKLEDKGATIITHCRSGARSMRACTALEGEGFEKIYNLDGGIMAWIAAGFPTI